MLGDSTLTNSDIARAKGYEPPTECSYFCIPKLLQCIAAFIIEQYAI